jgi:hypothetical protein
MTKMINEELFEDIYDKFEIHIRRQNNYRILFSGPFGVGKSTFLEWFFSNQQIQSEFEAYILSPVNYSIYSNEDILQYVKYDLIYKLVEKYPEGFKSKFISMGNAIETYVEYNKINVIVDLALLAPKYGKQAHQFLTIIKERWNEIQMIKKQAESSEFLLNDFTSAIQRTHGSIYESDTTTSIIEDLLLGSHPEKEKVLIIDDIDRIDPHHVFRLFNVFSAHLDDYSRSGKTKFGFDRIVFVCDERNIRNIYRNAYGADVDYNGYIDKFYSKRIFYFSNRAKLELAIEKIVRTAKIHSPEIKVENRLRDSMLYYHTLIPYVLVRLVKIGEINIRTLSKWSQSEVVIPPKIFIYDHRTTMMNYTSDLLIFLDVLYSIAGSTHQMENYLEELVGYNMSIDYDAERVIADAILILSIPLHKMRRLAEFNYSIEGQESQYRLHHPYTPSETYGLETIGEHKLSNKMMFNLLLEVFKSLKSSNYF